MDDLFFSFNENGAIIVARSMILGNRCPVDKTMEETFMKSAKSLGRSGNHGAGLTGLENNLGNYQRWVWTTHERTRYVEATFSMADMIAESRMSMKHKDLRPTEIRKEQGYSTVRVRSPDSDIFFILLLYVHELTVTLLFETGTGNKKKLINITELAEDFTGKYATSLTALHVFTKCDTTIAAKCIGKVKPIKLLQKIPRYQTILTELGKA
ncbi:hypothetical protein E2C01_031249 [Portunus trituberculatus]|uniref:Uncharacterized protein n=1 Tax=Portunus trituberculatus TaxID=210409 RepID=A0A5B7ESH7_PORTR|nr:hypothetical protein [Portunus trituberculatus]